MEKKILSRGAIYLVTVVVICELLSFIVPAESVTVQKNMINAVYLRRDKIESLAFGRSHGGSLDYNIWDKTGKNLSMGGQDIASIKYSLDYLSPELPHLKEVLICISYSSLYFDNEALSNGNLNDARKGLYAAIPSYTLISANDYNNMVFGKLFAFIQADYGFRKLVKALKDKEEKKASKQVSHIVVDTAKILQSGKIDAFDHSKDKKLALQYNPQIREQYLAYLKQIATELKAKKIKCIFYTPPFYKAYTDNYPPKDIEETEKVMAELCKQTGTTYYDFSAYKKMADNIALYSNADHLNEDGKEEFTQAFKQVLRDGKGPAEYPGLKIFK
ncbi:hypothetical protein LJ707_11755 [Mucilaginibacter sp. UR6-1]|uniref:hypothetical protein n=1 Tax=Mucilaginibacter sp. UR6-1 TaxID=1435643 RepID=UPI001E39A388|nr:hypothetical protein [Mucilaginibacter sp. UR6-1]MCC8409605.1 hypothetical protein [Mucilaginibacter sp. UR6-1]